MLSSRMTTSWPISTRRLARSMASSATVVWSSAGWSKVEWMTSPFTVRCMSVTSSGRSSTRTTMRWHSGLFLVMALAMDCRIIVLPALGGDDDVALAQAVLADLGERDVHIVRPGEVAGGADEGVPLRVEHVEDARDRDEHVILADHRLRVRLAVAPAVPVPEPVPAASAP